MIARFQFSNGKIGEHCEAVDEPSLIAAAMFRSWADGVHVDVYIRTGPANRWRRYGKAIFAPIWQNGAVRWVPGPADTFTATRPAAELMGRGFNNGDDGPQPANHDTAGGLR